MRAEDLERLEELYPDGAPPAHRFNQALGIHVEPVPQLSDAIKSDLDPGVFGIGWWAPEPGTSRRILISDYLLESVQTIQVNLVEAKLHLLELMDAWQQSQRFWGRSVGLLQNARIAVDPPIAQTPREEVSVRLAGLHIAGFFRAVAASLDCLGASVIGVAGLPTRLLFADLDRARGALEKAQHREHDALKAFLKDRIGKVGPAGWLEWATDYRNMLVHRARRVVLNHLTPAPIPLYDFQNRPIIRTESTPLLARDPGRSDIEVFLQGRDALVLTEAASDTLNGILASVRALAEDVARELLALWLRRRANPALLLQPREQWPDGPSRETTGFQGYRPGSATYDAKLLIGAPSVAPRFRAAALDDENRPRWAKFD